jgi:hypothetical protein
LRNLFKIILGLAAAFTFILSSSGTVRAAGATGKLNVDVECRCADPVGQRFCADFKQQLRKSAAYRLVDTTSGYGIAVHFSCVDMWKSIVERLSGHMSAVAVTFTVYADTLPGELFADDSIVRVGADSVGEASRQMVSALGQIVTANSATLDRLSAASSPAAGGGPGAAPESAETSGASTGSAETPVPSPEASAATPGDLPPPSAATPPF